jgi:hypothetical protein
MKSKSFFTIDTFIWTLLVVSQALSISFTQGGEWKERGFATTYLVASKLTDPLCNAHQFYRQILLVDALFSQTSTLERWVRKSLFFLSSSTQSFFSLFTTLPGIELRLMAKLLQDKPYIHFSGSFKEKQLQDKSISLLSWNLCCVSGGYAITDGGVLPWGYRIPQLTSALLLQNADIICLYEIFDIQTALSLIAGLKDDYCHFYFHIGPKAVGLSSGLFMASKIEITNPEFIPFPQESYDGRAKHCNKGFFSFDIQQQGRSFARIYATHLQHSEIPSMPTLGELRAREKAMDLILAHMHKYQDKACILTGDLNLEESEYHSSHWAELFDKGIITGTGCTWGCDKFCSSLVDKPMSSPLNLDHTLALKKAGVNLLTSYIETGFDGATFNPHAISDHKGLLTIITISD